MWVDPILSYLLKFNDFYRLILHEVPEADVIIHDSTLHFD